MSQLRMLYSSNAMWATSGYGVQGKSLLPRLALLPEFGSREALAMFAWYGLQGGVHQVDGFTVYPSAMDSYGNDIIGAHAKDHRADIVITLIDVWVVGGTGAKVAPALWLPWLPIDHDPVPQKVIDALGDAHLPLTYSKWGANMLRGVGINNTYIPHGIETSVFKILDSASVKRFRHDVLRNPEHLTVMVAANKGFPDRKAFQVQVRAWANFAKDKPGARLYIHTEPTTYLQGIDFAALLANLGIADKVYFPDRYQYHKGYPAEYMAMLYNCADAFLGASMAEGFGIPIIEAQACGVPVVVSDFSSMPELVRWGYKIQPADRVWSALNAWQCWPDVRGIQDALEEMYQQWHGLGRQWPDSLRLQTQQSIHAEFDWDTIVREQWGPLMTQLAAHMTPTIPTITTPPPPVVAKRNGHVTPVTPLFVAA
jgi:glycosyltransferase involved in cell wall biosynthesis